MGKRIVIDAPEREQHTVQLVGVEYLVTPPKAALAMKLSAKFGAKTTDADGKEVADSEGMQEGLAQFILAAFGKKQAADVTKRLEDPDDLLDYPQITELVSLLFEQETTDPPTSPLAS